MVEFLPIIIPENLQTEAIENYDDYRTAAPLPEGTNKILFTATV